MDKDEISALLHIHEKASAHGTSLTHIRDAAWQALQKINADHAPKPEEPEVEAEPVEPDPPAPAGDAPREVVNEEGEEQ